jgi:malonyl-ACP O-methyltransferase BioC/pimeloyl-ACP methyl ester esterase
MPEIVCSDGRHLAYEDVGTGPVLLFVHGWAMSGRVWQYQRNAFTATHRVITLDLTGHGSSTTPITGPGIHDFALDITTIMERLELSQVILIAWSMGVSAALQSYSSIAHRLAGLVLVGGTPCFTSRGDFHHGLSPDDVRGMALRLRRNFGRTMEEFFRDMFVPEELTPAEYGQIVKDIIKGARLPVPRTVLTSLESLAETDLRPLLSSVHCPTLIIHGEKDGICLPDASRFMEKTIPAAELILLPGLGHATFLSRSKEFNRILDEFLAKIKSTLLPSVRPTGDENQSVIDRQQVQTSFDRHAEEYESYARVQRRVVDRFLNVMRPTTSPPRSILDIGCGTGMLLRAVGDRYRSATLTGLDLAPGMVAATRASLGEREGVTLIIGDAEQLPFNREQFDLIISTSTFQWLENLSTAFDEVYRVLIPGGSFRFALFGFRTLCELKESYRSALNQLDAESADPTHDFRTTDEVTRAFSDAGFTELHVWSEIETEYHRNVAELLTSLKKIGAGNASPDKKRSLAQRRVLLKMIELYEESYGEAGVIPATYEVIYGEGMKRA